MDINVDRKSVKFFSVFAVGIAAFLVLPVQIPYTISVPGKLLPAREWTVFKGTDGRLMAVLQNHKDGVSEKFSVAQFERGDAVEFNLHPDFKSSSTVVAGDTVAMIYSNEIERQLVHLKGELASEMATLKLYLTGEKESIINEAKRRLAYEKKQAEEQKKQYQRMKELYERDLISEQEFELAQSNSQLLDLGVAIAEARLRTVESGAKDEQIAMVRSRVEALQQEIQTLQRRLNDYTMTSPISGIVHRVFSSDTLFTVADTTEYVVIMPVKVKHRRYLSLQQSVTVKAAGFSSIGKSRLIKLDRGFHNLNGHQVIIATAAVDQKLDEGVPGLMVQCSIKCGSVSLLEFVKRKLGSFFV